MEASATTSERGSTETFDLTRLAADLAGAGLHRGLVGRIEKVVAVASAHKDLGDARTALDLLARLTDGDPEDDRDLQSDGPVGAALFAHAVILYARATGTSSDDRTRWFGPEKLEEASREPHGDVMAYRNEVLAHFGRGLEHPDGPTVREALVYSVIRTGERSQVRVDFLDARALTKVGLQAKLHALLDEVLALSRAVYDRRSADLVEELGRVASFDRSLRDRVRRHPLDPDAFFGGALTPDRIRELGGTASYAVVEGGREPGGTIGLADD